MSSDDHAAMHRPFRPRAARYVAIAAAVAFVAGIGFLAVVVPARLSITVPWADRVGYALLAVGVAWLLLRHAGVRALPDDDGLTVRNLIYTRHVAWPQVVSVRFGPDRPWVQLDLADGSTLAVMGIQRADGDYATREARRLATLVAYHSRPPHDD